MGSNPSTGTKFEIVVDRKNELCYCMARYECKKCNRSFQELELWGHTEFCGDHWRCTCCDEDITKNLDDWWKEVNAMADLLNPFKDNLTAP